MTLKDIHLKIEMHLGEELYQHSLGVAATARELALRFGADDYRAYLAGLLHDYGKGYEPDKLLEMAGKLGLVLDYYSRMEKRLLHAPVGAALLPVEMGIDDKEIIAAVACHTTGSPEMNIMGKVVYLADFIEPGRKFPGVDKIRRIAGENLDEALLAVVDETIISIVKRGLLLHPLSVSFRNSLIENKLEGS